MPGEQGFSACFSSFARAWSNMAPTDAKASCLYPNGQRAIREAVAKGFDNAIMLDGNGHVAEFATANLWIAKDGVVATPADNGTSSEAHTSELQSPMRISYADFGL